MRGRWVAKNSLGITGLPEILGRDHGLKHPIGDPLSMQVIKTEVINLRYRTSSKKTKSGKHPYTLSTLEVFYKTTYKTNTIFLMYLKHFW